MLLFFYYENKYKNKIDRVRFKDKMINIVKTGCSLAELIKSDLLYPRCFLFSLKRFLKIFELSSDNIASLIC